MTQGDINCGGLLPDWLHSKLFQISFQISSKFLKFPLKFSISSQPGWQAVTFNVILSWPTIKSTTNLYPLCYWLGIWLSLHIKSHIPTKNVVSGVTTRLLIEIVITKPCQFGQLHIGHQNEHIFFGTCQQLCGKERDRGDQQLQARLFFWQFSEM